MRYTVYAIHKETREANKLGTFGSYREAQRALAEDLEWDEGDNPEDWDFDIVGKDEMRTFREWLRDERNLEMPENTVPGSWFAENGLPMVVRCTCCETTMALPSAYLNHEGEIFCSSCATCDV
jgi:hypothetical protein